MTSDDLLKRRGVNFDPETTSQDSSSLSEFSSTTGTDERSVQSPLREFGEGHSTPIDINMNGMLSDTQISATLIPDSGYKGDSSLDVTMCSNKFQLLDSGINLTEDRGSVSELAGDPSINDRSPIAQADVKKTAELPKRFKKAKSVDTSNKPRKTSLQKSATVDVPDNLLPSRKGSRRFWENSLVLIESDSDSDESLGLLSSSSPPPQSSKSSCYSKIDEPIITSGYSKIEVLGPRNSRKQENSEHCNSNHHFEEVIYSEPAKDGLQISNIDTTPYANMEIVRVTMTQKTINDAAARARSKSSSPRVPKKPKPLPRILLQREGGGRSELVTSLPTDFKHHPFVKVSMM